MPQAKTKKTSTKSAKTPTKATSARQNQDKNSSQDPKTSAKERAQQMTTTLGTKLRQPKFFVPIIIVILLALLYLFRSAFIVAVVNGQPVSRAEFNQMLEAQAGKQVMNALVTQTLIEQEAARQHITVSQSELDSQVKNIQDQLAKQGQTLDSALAAQGMTRSEFMTQLRLQSIVKKLLASKIKVTDQEVADYINKNKDALPTNTPPDQLNAQVRQQLEQQKLSQQAQTLVQKLQQQAKITYFTN